jgi:hypothetical protein
MGDVYDEYYLAVSQHTTILADLAEARTQLSELLRDVPATAVAVKRLQSKIKLLVRLALASQQAVAMKEEALGQQ